MTIKNFGWQKGKGRKTKPILHFRKTHQQSTFLISLTHTCHHARLLVEALPGTVDPSNIKTPENICTKLLLAHKNSI